MGNGDCDVGDLIPMSIWAGSCRLYIGRRVATVAGLYTARDAGLSSDKHSPREQPELSSRCVQWLPHQPGAAY